jgi:hypothetical protein
LDARDLRCHAFGYVSFPLVYYNRKLGGLNLDIELDLNLLVSVLEETVMVLDRLEDGGRMLDIVMCERLGRNLSSDGDALCTVPGRLAWCLD